MRSTPGVKPRLLQFEAHVRKIAVKQFEIERAIRAAQKCGLHVVAVRTDGTVITSESPQAAEFAQLSPAPKVAPLRRSMLG